VALVDGLVAWESFPELAVRPFRPAVDMEIVLVTSGQRPEARFAKEFGRDLAAAVADRPGRGPHSSASDAWDCAPDFRRLGRQHEFSPRRMNSMARHWTEKGGS